jgi:hypothetical protein
MVKAGKRLYVCNVGKLLKTESERCEYAHSARLTKKLIMKTNDAFCTTTHITIFPLAFSFSSSKKKRCVCVFLLSDEDDDSFSRRPKKKWRRRHGEKIMFSVLKRNNIRRMNTHTHTTYSLDSTTYRRDHHSRFTLPWQCDGSEIVRAKRNTTVHLSLLNDISINFSKN